MYLTATTDRVEVVNDTAGTLDVSAYYTDLTLADGAVTPGRQFNSITTATTTEVVSEPASGVVRLVKKLCIRNSHASLSNVVTVNYEDNATSYQQRRETLAAGDQLDWTEGVGWFKSAQTPAAFLRRFLSADATGQNINTVQPVFPTNGAVTVQAATAYYITGQLSMTRAAGTTSHTTGMSWTGTATLTGLQYSVRCNTGDVETTIADAVTTIRTASNTQIKIASTSATEAISALIHGIIRVNLGGTLIWNFTYSAAPGGAPTIKANTYLFLEPIGTNTATTVGTWS